MSTPGLSLIGFIQDRDRAINHLRHDCIAASGTTDAQLEQLWRNAQGQLGPPVPGAGMANPRPMPATSGAYIGNLIAQAWVQEGLATLTKVQADFGLPPPDFKMVEIDKLLAYQITVDSGRSGAHCAPLSSPPTEQELLSLCLPNRPPANEEYFRTPITDRSRSVVVKLRNHNLRMHTWGIFDVAPGIQVAGVLFRIAMPFVHVVSLNGRCYLHNGYHRVSGARAAGATEIPCIYREVPTPGAAGINADGSTFDEVLLTSQNPPTLSHFDPAKALSVNFRQKSRLIHVAWEEYSVPDEYD